MTEGEAIKYITEVKERAEANMAWELVRMWESVIGTLEKQIPKKPIIDFQESGDFYWYCPSCKEVVKSELVGSPMANEYNHSFCCGCGQKIDWSEEE